MILQDCPVLPNPLRQAMNKAYRMDENTCVNNLLEYAELSQRSLQHIETKAAKLVQGVRETRKRQGGLDAFLMEYDLSSEEGIALMCLAESLLRIPDKATINKLIIDKIGDGEWHEHKGQSDSLFVNWATWGLMLTGKILTKDKNGSQDKQHILRNLVKKSGLPAIRLAVNRMMKIMSQQFVMGQTIDDAVKRARDLEKNGYCYSYDMLGEAARTWADAERYYKAYEKAIAKLAKISQDKDEKQSPGISIKLSALHPRYEFTKSSQVVKELSIKILQLAKLAADANINLTIDAEEATRLDLSLDIFEIVFSDPSLKDWQGFGLAVQSYQKRAFYLIDWLIDLAKKHQKRIMVRLIKGAYWDSEIKHSQVMGFEGYPVFTRKGSTDVSFIACAKKIIANTKYIFPQFATHNAYSLSAVLEMVGDYRDFEFQCLHGMGRPLYDQIVGKNNLSIPCRIYAPVGGYQDLLAYLVRRLLENGANTSFVNRIVDEKTNINDLVQSPVEITKNIISKPHPHIPLPKNLYGDSRLNSYGLDLSDRLQCKKFKEEIEKFEKMNWHAMPLIVGQNLSTGERQSIYSPYNSQQLIGDVISGNIQQIPYAINNAKKAFPRWQSKNVEVRANCLLQAANLLEKNSAKFISLLIKEAGKTLNDCISEVREAVDFCRYYAMQAKKLQQKAIELPGPTGEFNALSLHGRGIFICISPWNFPLAIFLGQIVAALIVGNVVIAKPAEQTALIGFEAVKLLHEAGVPTDVLQFIPGQGEIIGQGLVESDAIAGVMFTGSTQAAKLINLCLAKRNGPIIPFIAETGGQNAMIVDSTALPEQLVVDVMQSAFGSAGQRCSALRVLYLQHEIANKVISMLQGAMALLTVDDPENLATDIGPVIDEDALKLLKQHIDESNVIYQTPIKNSLTGYFISPTLIELKNINELSREHFGPVLHIIRYHSEDLDKIIADINNTGYGLTFGIQSRITESCEYIYQRMHIGNCYVNRNIIGAVVGVQPFGGEGLSGTGPKAGGPHYLLRLCSERTLTIDTTAQGGNATLLSLTEE